MCVNFAPKKHDLDPQKKTKMSLKKADFSVLSQQKQGELQLRNGMNTTCLWKAKIDSPFFNMLNRTSKNEHQSPIR